MSIQHELIQMISRVAQALGPELSEQMAFVGGVTTGLLLTDDFTREQVRSTDDVDLIVHVIGTMGFAALQEQLQEKGFHISIPSPDEDLPICAMKLDGMRVDGREELIEEIKGAPPALWEDIAYELAGLLEDRYFQMAAQSQAQGDASRLERLNIRLEQLAKSRPC